MRWFFAFLMILGAAVLCYGCGRLVVLAMAFLSPFGQGLAIGGFVGFIAGWASFLAYGSWVVRRERRARLRQVRQKLERLNSQLDEVLADALRRQSQMD